MKKTVTVYFSPINLEIELADNLSEEEMEQEINKQIYDVQTEDITNATAIDFWED